MLGATLSTPEALYELQGAGQVSPGDPPPTVRSSMPTGMEQTLGAVPIVQDSPVRATGQSTPTGEGVPLAKETLTKEQDSCVPLTPTSEEKEAQKPGRDQQDKPAKTNKSQKLPPKGLVARIGRLIVVRAQATGSNLGDVSGNRYYMF